MNLDLVEEITGIEFEMFSSVNNTGGPASCQSDRKTFQIMRTSQLEIYNDEILESWLSDLKEASASGRNLMTEKYARMMESTHPDEFARIKDQLPDVPGSVAGLSSEITKIFMEWDMEMAEKYPGIMSRGRNNLESEDTPFTTSKETYLKSELLTYSEKTLSLIAAWVKDHNEKKVNLAEKLLLATVKKYGYTDLQAAESAISSGRA